MGINEENGPQDSKPKIDVATLRALLPELGTAGLAAAPAAAPPARGRLLKLKLGFNPNSSSVGTTVVVFLWSLVASGAVLALATAILAHRFRRRRTAAPPPADGGSQSAPEHSA